MSEQEKNDMTEIPREDELEPEQGQVGADAAEPETPGAETPPEGDGTGQPEPEPETGDSADQEVNPAPSPSGEGIDEATGSESPAEPPAASGTSTPVAAAVAVEKPAMGDTVIISIVCLILGLLFVFGCNSLAAPGNAASAVPDGEAAAIVGDVKIPEGDIASIIYKTRYIDLGQPIWDDKEWAQWLADQGFSDTAAVREAILTQKVSEEVLRQATEEYEVTVTDEDVENAYKQACEENGGEDTFKETLELYGMTVEDYYESARAGLAEEKLMDKVLSGKDYNVSDDEIFETIQMYFPDQVDKKTKSLKDVDEETVKYVRESMESSAKYEAFENWLADYKASKGVTINPAPENLPYAVDMSGVETQSDDGTFDLSSISEDGSEMVTVEADEDAEELDDAAVGDGEDSGNGNANSEK